MSYHKQLQKQKRKQMAMVKEKQNRPKNNAYSQAVTGGTWKVVLSIMTLAGVIVYTLNTYPGM